MKLKTRHIIGIIIGVALIAISLILFRSSNFIKPLIVFGIIIATSQFWIDMIAENKRQNELELQFLEFSRALESTVRSGIPIPKAIKQISSSDYGALTPYVRKLTNQLDWGIPLSEALIVFAKDTNNKVIKKSVSILNEAERSGGNIEIVLNAVTNSVLQIKRIKEERKANAYSQLVQGYIIFFIFIAIMLILQIYLMPQLADISGALFQGLRGGFISYIETGGTTAESQINLENIFLALISIQGIFAGLMIGKFAEGEVKAGIKHSLILTILGYFISTTALTIF